jgi:hypothetical protein
MIGTVIEYSLQKSYGMAVPAWVESVYPQMEKLAPLFFDPRVIVPNDEAKRVKAGPLLSFLVKNMDVKRDSPALSKAEKDAHRKAKFYMVSGHDTTGSIALGAINVFETQFPPYASTAIFEMHKGRKNQREDNIGDHFVRVSTGVTYIQKNLNLFKFRSVDFQYRFPKADRKKLQNKFRMYYTYIRSSSGTELLSLTLPTNSRSPNAAIPANWTLSRSFSGAS